MSVKVNHGKVSMQKRIAYEARVYGHTGRGTDASDFQQRHNSSGWLSLEFGKHTGKTLPQIAFTDPDYLMWLYENDVLLRSMDGGNYALNLAHQLEVVHNRMSRIKPPLDCEFAILVSSRDVFRKFLIVRKVRPLIRPSKPGREISQSLDILSIGLPNNYVNSRLGFENLARCFTTTFLKNVQDADLPRLCQAFLEDNHNFDLRDVKLNKTLKLGRDDRAFLECKAKQSVILRDVNKRRQ